MDDVEPSRSLRVRSTAYPVPTVRRSRDVGQRRNPCQRCGVAEFEDVRVWHRGCREGEYDITVSTVWSRTRLHVMDTLKTR